MTLFHGKAGRVYWGAIVAGVSRLTSVLDWNADATADTAESTAMGADWKTFLAGFKEWDATVSLNADDGGNEIPYSGNLGLGDDDDGTAIPVTLELWFGATVGEGILRGPAICNGIANAQDKDDVSKLNYTFKGTGALVPVTS